MTYRKKRKVSQRFHEHYGQHSHNGIDDWLFTLIEQCKTYEQLKERETFWQHILKRFTLMGLMKRKNIYIELSFLTLLVLGIQFSNRFNFAFILVSCFNFIASIKQLTKFWIHFCTSYFFTLIFNGLENYLLLLPVICYFLSFFLSFFSFLLFIFIIYLFITATYCQLISVYQLINNYLLICFIITLKVSL